MAKSKSADIRLIVQSKIKEAVTDMNVSADVVNALNEVAHWHLERAANRAKLNGRRTVQARDL